MMKRSGDLVIVVIGTVSSAQTIVFNQITAVYVTKNRFVVKSVLPMKIRRNAKENVRSLYEMNASQA